MTATEIREYVENGGDLSQIELVEITQLFVPSRSDPAALARALENHPEFFDMEPREFAMQLERQRGVTGGVVGNMLGVFAFLAYIARVRGESATMETEESEVENGDSELAGVDES